jgi:hypothetical protein
MQVHNLKETMTKKGVEFARECLIFEICQPQQAKKVLEQNMSVSTSCAVEGFFHALELLKCSGTHLVGFHPIALEGINCVMCSKSSILLMIFAGVYLRRINQKKL